MSDLPVRPLVPAQADGESPGEFQCFRAWLECSPRPAPATLGAPIAELAARHSWLARAQTWDAERGLGLRTKSPVELLRDGLRLHLETGLNEAAKLRALSASSASMVVDPATAIGMTLKSAELAQSIPAPPAAVHYDYSRLDVNELETLRTLLEKATPK